MMVIPSCCFRPLQGVDVIEISDSPIDTDALQASLGDPAAGGYCAFEGWVRNENEGHTVERLEYEAYEEHVVPRLAAIAGEARSRFPTVGRIVLLHRIGVVPVGDSSVVVVASAPHRPEAFDAARFGIDTLKATVPIWKREHWDGGTDWGLASQEIREVEAQ